MQNQDYKSIPRSLSSEDKEFIKLIQEAKIPRSKAFLAAYPEHEHSVAYRRAIRDKNKEAKKRAGLLLVQVSKTKLQAQYIVRGLTTFQNKMDQLAEDSIDVLDDILNNGRSEKVRADIGIEMLRHKVGTPVHKMAVKEERTVYLTFSDPDGRGDMPEATVVESNVQDPNQSEQ